MKKCVLRFVIDVEELPGQKIDPIAAKEILAMDCEVFGLVRDVRITNPASRLEDFEQISLFSKERRPWKE